MTVEKTESRNGDKTVDSTRKAPAKWLQVLVALALLTGGGVGALVLVKSGKPPPRVEQEVPAPLVEVAEVRVGDIRMVINGFGTVQPKVEVEIVPQVAGKIVYANPQFRAGGSAKAGVLLLQIDPLDYELSVQQAEAVVADAQVKLDLEKAEAQVARIEWEQLHGDSKPESPLVLREPQIRQAKARLESAVAQLATAKLNLERTKISLPIDAMITDKRVDLGQFVTVGQRVGNAYGIEAMEIEVPLEDEDLAWFDMAGGLGSVNGGAASSPEAIAQVKVHFGGAEHTWTGHVKRTTGQVDRTSRLVSVVVEIPQPFARVDSRPALLPGTFVQVSIEGKVLRDAAVVPRDAVRNGREVWVVRKGRLHIQPLEIARADREFAYATGGLEDGERIVVSSLDVVTDGMEVRIGGAGQDLAKTGTIAGDGVEVD
jgi:RND family efflux transporter MFP subunit